MGSKEGRGWCHTPTRKSQSPCSRRCVWGSSLYLVPLPFPDLRAPKARLCLLDVDLEVFWGESPKNTCSLGPSRGSLATGRGWGMG